jgi:hypothetical protein
MKQAKVKQRTLHGGFVNYKNAFDMMPHSWLLLIIRLYKVCENIQEFFAHMMQIWKTTIVVTSGTQEIALERCLSREAFSKATLSAHCGFVWVSIHSSHFPTIAD